MPDTRFESCKATRRALPVSSSNTLGKDEKGEIRIKKYPIYLKRIYHPITKQ